jgi:hypothetical protein
VGFRFSTTYVEKEVVLAMQPPGECLAEPLRIVTAIPQHEPAETNIILYASSWSGRGRVYGSLVLPG